MELADAVGAWGPILKLVWRNSTHFSDFLEEESEKKELKFVSKDLWKSVWLFAKEVDDDGTNWSRVDDGMYTYISYIYICKTCYND